jgi:predicted metallopeptidase
MKQASSTGARRFPAGASQAGRAGRAAVALGLFTLFTLGAACAGTAAAGDTHAAAVTAQSTFSGTWTAELRDNREGERLQFSIRTDAERGSGNFSGSDYSLADFQGLTREQISARTDTPVNFRLVREAGTVECRGSFRNGKGSGTWVLSPSQSFRSAMSGRGYGELTDREMLTATLLNLTVGFVDDLKSVGFDRLSFDDTVKALIFKVTPQYVAEMKSLGFDNLDLEELVKARIFKVDAEFARQVQEMGFAGQSLEELVKLRIFKVTPDFLEDLKAEGFSQVSIEDAVKLKIFNIDRDFIRRAKASHADLSIEELVQLRIHGRVR